MQVKGSSSSKETLAFTHSSICPAPGEPNWSHCSQMEPARSLFPVEGAATALAGFATSSVKFCVPCKIFKLPPERQIFYRNHIS